MRVLQKLVRCGNATHVSVPRPMMLYLGWLPGHRVIVELLEDKSIRLRMPSADEFAMQGMKPVQLDDTMPVSK